MKSEYLRSKDVRWHQSRVIFIAPSFTDNQLRVAEFWASIPLGKEFAFELWEVKQFSGGEIIINPVKKSVPAVREESYDPSESRLIDGKPDYTVQLYKELKKSVLRIEKGISIRPKSQEIGFIFKDRTFMNVSVHRGYLKLWLNVKRGGLKDPRRLARDVSKIRHWGSGDYEIRIRDTKDLEYIIGLIKQAINVKRKT